MVNTERPDFSFIKKPFIKTVELKIGKNIGNKIIKKNNQNFDKPIPTTPSDKNK